MKLAYAALLATVPLAANGAPTTLILDPADMLAQTHSRGMFLPVTGTFRQLSGTLNYDPVAQSCAVNVTFVVRSLELPNAIIRSQTMSASFLDPQDYPTQHYSGTCQGNTVVGFLTMHGQTHPFNMAITSDPNGFHMEGTLNRFDWGIEGMSLTVGQNIRVTDNIALAGQRPEAAE